MGSVARAGLRPSSSDSASSNPTTSLVEGRGDVGVGDWRAVVPTKEHENVDRVPLGPVDSALIKEHRIYRFLEVLASVCGLIVLTPALALIALVIKVDSRGPVLYRQRRVGRWGRTFMCLKFRSMAVDAEERLLTLLEENPEMAEEFAAHQKLERDPRVTRVGRILRATKLDELPQLINVIDGEMALVGPRPVVVPEVTRYGADAATVFSVRPGLTGPWQVAQDEEMPYDQRVALDVEYVINRTWQGDVRIVARTLEGLIGRR